MNPPARPACSSRRIISAALPFTPSPIPAACISLYTHLHCTINEYIFMAYNLSAQTNFPPDTPRRSGRAAAANEKAHTEYYAHSKEGTSMEEWQAARAHAEQAAAPLRNFSAHADFHKKK